MYTRPIGSPLLHRARWVWIAGLLACLAAFPGTLQAQCPAKTQVSDTLLNADGSTASGRVVIAWPTFLIGSCQVIAGQVSVPVTDGAFDVELYPNDAAVPAGTSYRVTYYLRSGRVTTEYWVVPSSSTPVTLATVRSSSVPVPAVMFSMAQVTSLLPTLDAKVELPSSCPAGKFLQTNGSASPPQVECVDGTGAPLATSSVSGTVKTDVDEADPLVYTKATADALLANKADAAHAHNAADISTGTLDSARLPAPTATTLGGVQSGACAGSDKVTGISTAGAIVCGADQTGSGGSASQHQVDGVNLAANDPVNFQNSATIDFSNPSAGNVEAAVKDGSIATAKLADAAVTAAKLADAAVGTAKLSSGAASAASALFADGAGGAAYRSIQGSDLPNPAAGAKGGVTAVACSGTDKIREIGADGVPVCAPDEAGEGSNHNLLSATHLDTVAASPVLGDMLFGDSTPAWTRLAGNTTTTRQFLRQVGDGTASAAPAWDTLLAADIPNLDASKITTGTLDDARLSANVSLLAQTIESAEITDGTIATADIGDNQVTDAKLADRAATSVIGRSANSTGDPADIAAANDGEALSRASGVLGFGFPLAHITWEAAYCSNTTATEGMDLPTSGAPTAACHGTTTTQGSLDFADAATSSATRHFRLPGTWTSSGGVDARLVWFANSASTNAVRWQASIGCVADSEAVNTGPTYNTASAENTAYTGTANQRTTTTFTGVAVTNCTAGESAWLKVERIGGDAGDTLAATAHLLEVEVTVRKALR